MGSHPDELRVLVADDHALYRRGLVVALDECEDIEVVAEAADGRAAAEAAVALAPDVALVDLDMPGAGGIEATRRIRAAAPTIRVVVLAVDDRSEALLDAVAAGARGAIGKESPLSEIATVVRRVARGHAVVPPHLAAMLLDEFARQERSGGPGTGPVARLTTRERCLLDALARGADDRRIADMAGCDVVTARNHVRNVVEKLEVATRTEAVLRAATGGALHQSRDSGR